MMSQSSSKVRRTADSACDAIIHLAISEPPRLTIPVTLLCRQMEMLEQQDPAVDRHVVDALSRLMFDHIQESAVGFISSISPPNSSSI